MAQCERCGDCLQLMSTPVSRVDRIIELEARVRDLEHRMSQMLGLAEEWEQHPPIDISVEFETLANKLGVQVLEDAAAGERITCLAIQPDKLTGWARCFKNGIKQLGEWSRLREVEESLMEQRKVNQDLALQRNRVVAVVIDMLKEGEHGQTTRHAASSLLKLGGNSAVASWAHEYDGSSRVSYGEPL